jgi:hypothetical protein
MSSCSIGQLRIAYSFPCWRNVSISLIIVAPSAMVPPDRPHARCETTPLCTRDQRRAGVHSEPRGYSSDRTSPGQWFSMVESVEDQPSAAGSALVEAE